MNFKFVPNGRYDTLSNTKENALHLEDEKRIDSRQMCSELVEISFQDQTGTLVCEKGLLEDLSQEGLCVSLGIPVTVGSEVEFRCDGFRGKARVRYCNLGEYGYLVGAEFADGCGWDQQRWRPKYLTSFRDLA